MSTFLANENVPADAVFAARAAGHDVAWMVELAPGIKDPTVLARSLAGGRVLVTFDKDFGELTFRRGLDASSGVILLRPRLQSPAYVTGFILNVLAQPIGWEGHFTVAQEGRIRVVPIR